MCGISGYYSSSPGSRREEITRMTRALQHRGPDALNIWSNEYLALGHARLSILDLANGSQPFFSRSGRNVLVFNGEIYNYRNLKKQLEELGVSFRTQSDTEVLLEAIENWGLNAALKKVYGMFAFAYYHSDRQELFLARDRMGEKPLFFAEKSGKFLFSSELKGIRAVEDFPIREASVAEFLRYSFVPSPFTIFEGVKKLPPASVLRYCLKTRRSEISTFWQIENKSKSWEDPITTFTTEFEQVVREQMVADVPVGAFLSGGIDSSLVTAMMQKVSSRKVKTFTIGFQETSFNEAKFAKKVATHLGTDHHELYVDSRDALRTIERLPTIYDEPFADSSQIPTFLVSELARKQVKVSLSGDGGDEVFAGYNRHNFQFSFWNKLRSIPSPLRALMGRSLAQIAKMAPDQFFGALESKEKMPNQLQLKLLKLANCLQAKDDQDLYLRFISIFPDSTEVYDRRVDLCLQLAARSFQELDAHLYLVDDILTKVDRATMAVGLESRAPFLDARMVEFGFSLPQAWRVQGGRGKILLRKALQQFLPPTLFDRPKSGFAIPINSWLRGDLKPWAEATLYSAGWKEIPGIRTDRVMKLWQNYVAGEEIQYPIWNLLMLASWVNSEAKPRVAKRERELDLSP